MTVIFLLKIVKKMGLIKARGPGGQTLGRIWCVGPVHWVFQKSEVSKFRRAHNQVKVVVKALARTTHQKSEIKVLE